MENGKRKMWDSRSGPMALIHVALRSTHHISTTHMFSYRNININNRKQSCTRIQEYPCSNNLCNSSSDLCNRNI